MAIGITTLSTYNTHTIYEVNFFGDYILTTVTSDFTAVSEWISEVIYIHRSRYNRGTLVAGLDVEWRPNLTRNRQNPVATVQICVGRRCLVYQIIHSGGRIPKSLDDFLSEGFATFVGVGVKDDIDKLRNDYGIGLGARTVDLTLLAFHEYRRPRLIHAGLKEIARLVLGIDMAKPKRVTVSNWDNRRLSDEQVQYACVDAYVSFDIGRILKAFTCRD